MLLVKNGAVIARLSKEGTGWVAEAPNPLGSNPACLGSTPIAAWTALETRLGQPLAPENEATAFALVYGRF